MPPGPSLCGKGDPGGCGLPVSEMGETRNGLCVRCHVDVVLRLGVYGASAASGSPAPCASEKLFEKVSLSEFALLRRNGKRTAESSRQSLRCTWQARIIAHALLAGWSRSPDPQRYGFSSAVSRRNPHGHLPLLRSNRCEPYRAHFLNCLGLPPNSPFFALAACLAGVLANPPTRPPRRPSSAAAFDSVDSCMPTY